MTPRILFAAALLAFATTPVSAAPCPSVLSHEVANIVGERENLCEYAGKVVLVVNVASYCGYTPQYKGLQALNERYKKRGLVILGFPSNDFGKQEPGSEKEIAEFCDRTYAVKFPMFAKTSVAPGASALYDDLAKATGNRPQWNFHKYLIARDGQKVASFPSDVEPESRRLRAQGRGAAGPLTSSPPFTTAGMFSSRRHVHQRIALHRDEIGVAPLLERHPRRRAPALPRRSPWPRGSPPAASCRT